MDAETVQEFILSAQGWVTENVLTWPTAVQAAVIVVAFVAAIAVGRPLRPFLERVTAEIEIAKRLVAVLVSLTTFILWVFLQWIALLIATGAEQPNRLLEIVVNLLTAWIFIRVVSSLITNAVWARFIAIVVWSIAALSILDLLLPVMEILDSFALTLGDVRVSALTVIQGVLLLTVLLWAAIAVSSVLERRISDIGDLTPSVQVLLSKMLKIVLIIVAILAAISSAGINLSAFAFFGGALGLGIGFGMQRIVSNLVSGVILLLDKSVKPGDYIAVGDTFGWIDSLGARYAAVVTRDGTEHLIPNEELITTRVENWSHSNNLARLKVAVGVSYATDLPRAIDVCTEAGASVDRILTYPEPKTIITDFGDSSINLEVRVWINDPQNGRSNVMSDVRLAVWKALRDNNIEIPFPQRDLHIKEGTAIS